MDKQRQKYKGLLDMIDGGGAGAVGNEFEGGGLFSVLANALATPFGSEDRAKQEALAGLLGKVRPEMRPDRPAPSSAPVYSGRGNVGMPMRDGVYSGRGNVGMPMPASQMPLTQASDIPGGFNPASAAPVQVSPQTTGQSPMEMFGGQQPAAYESSPKMQAERFVADLNAQYPGQAQSILISPMAQGVFDDYIRNGYQLPAL